MLLAEHLHLHCIAPLQRDVIHHLQPLQPGKLINLQS
jgi:hypothetical protein